MGSNPVADNFIFIDLPPSFTETRDRVMKLLVVMLAVRVLPQHQPIFFSPGDKVFKLAKLR